MKKINIRLRKSSKIGIFHDTRGDVKRLAQVCNLLIDKVNELTEEVEILKSKDKTEQSEVNNT